MSAAVAEIKRSLSRELKYVVQEALRASEDNGETVSVDITTKICNVVEAIFIHGLKSIHFLGDRRSKYPEPNLWELLVKFSPRGLRSSIGSLSQIRTPIGRSRAWIHLALNDGVLENYLASFAGEKATLRLFYHRHAYLLDSEAADIFRSYLKALAKIQLNAPTNSAFLNAWTPTPLRLAGLLSKPKAPISAVAEMDAISEEIGQAAHVQEAEDALSLLGSADKSLDESDRFSVFSGTSSVTHDAPSAFGRSPFAGGHNRYSDGAESSVYSHPSLVDDKFNAIMREMESRRSSSSGPRRDEDEFGDSGIGTDPPTASAPVVVRRSGANSSFRRRAAVRSAANASKSKSSIASAFPSISPKSQEASPVPGEAKMEEPEQQEPRPPSLMEEMAAAEKDTDTAESTPFASPAKNPATSSDLEESFKTAVELSSSDSAEPKKEEQEAQPEPLPEPQRPPSVAGGISSPLNQSLTGTGGWWSGEDSGSSIHPGDVSSPAETSESRGSTFCEAVGRDAAASFNQLLTQTLERYETEQNRDDEPQTLTKEAEDGPESATPMSPIPQDFEEMSEAQVDEAVKGPIKKDEATGKDVGDWREALLTRLPQEQGLDRQDYRCATCRRHIGLMYGPWRICAFDGRAYCHDCHREDSLRLPARIVLSWDLRQMKVSRASKAFLEHVGDKPIIQMDQANSSLYDAVGEMGKVLELRTQLSFVTAYLLTCKESIREELRKRLTPREYLHSDIHLYSPNDLVAVSTGALAKQLTWVVAWAEEHVANCVLCSQKGFICTFCNQPPVVFPFQLSITHRCPDCLTVSHKACAEAKPCPTCARKAIYARQRAESEMEHDIDLPPLDGL